MWYVHLIAYQDAEFMLIDLQQVGWVLPFLWAGVWTAITIPWVQRSLSHEYEQWTTAKWKA